MYYIKTSFKYFICFVLLLIFLVLTYINLNPEFGSNPSRDDKKLYSTFEFYNNGEFKNKENYIGMTGEMPMSEFFKTDSVRRPPKVIKTQNIDLIRFLETTYSNIKIAWLGHSAFMLNIEGNIILLDPMLGEYASPIPLPLFKRYSSVMPFKIEELDSIDVVILSHDHYDHLDYGTINKIKNKVNQFIVPHGIGSHLKSWGVEEKKIIELNWEESFFNNEVEFVCLPALHFSGRGVLNKNSTLWASWALKSQFGKIYFSGDSGYGQHFKNIGKDHGPFDLALIDCGQYNSAWKYSHMFPEQAVLAAKDLKSNYFIPIHWGAFTLSTHPWAEPVNQAITYAAKAEQKILTPQIGQVVFLENSIVVNEDHWWKFF